MTEKKVTGVLQSDWSAVIQDYPIASGWTHDGGALVVCDSAGGVYVFDAKVGELLWSERCAHEGGAQELHGGASTPNLPVTARWRLYPLS